MAAVKVDSNSEVTDAMQASKERDIQKMMTYSQRGRIEDQRCSLSPVHCPATKSLPPGSKSLGFNEKQAEFDTDHGSTPQIAVTESTPDRSRKLLSPGNHLEVSSERGRSASIGAEKSEDQQKFMNMISHGQRGRMEDQRCSIIPCKSAPCSPQHSDKASGAVSDDFLKVLASSQSRRLDDQRVSLPSLPGLGTNKDTSARDSGYLCYMVSKVQGSRIDDQRCSLPQILPDKGKLGKTSPGSDAGTQDSEKFFKMLANSQGRRIDDQRMCLPSLPGIKSGSAPSTKKNSSSSHLGSHLQTSQLDEHRCSAPNIYQNLGASIASRKNQPSRSSGNGLQRTFSLTRSKSGKQQQISSSEEEQFRKMMSHAQRGRMEEQRCSLQHSEGSPATQMVNGSALNNIPTAVELDAFFKVLSAIQARRLDDQRVALPVLPGTLGRNEDKCQSTRDSTCASTPSITVVGCTPTTARREPSAPHSSPRVADGGLDAYMGLSKSASFTPETEHQKELNAASQMTLRVSMSFTPQPGKKIVNHPVTYPEVFLTFGAPGDKLVIPLSPSPSRPLSLDLSLVPKNQVQSREASPRRAYSKPSSPSITYTHAAASCSHEQEIILTSTISPEDGAEIRMVHTAELQKTSAKGGQKSKGDHEKGKGCAKKGKKNGNNKR